MAIPTHENGVVRPPAATYRIRVADVLGDEWTDRTQGMAVSVRHRGRVDPMNPADGPTQTKKGAIR